MLAADQPPAAGVTDGEAQIQAAADTVLEPSGGAADGLAARPRGFVQSDGPAYLAKAAALDNTWNPPAVVPAS
ncbi:MULTISPECIES: hypothetical protein [unclassified Parafrankia]|uniref:hypothetical protein n=1 Tax=unclassified Parafrankia TaxID=2994368 RepID=UPI000DA55349|nr:MULTISPECIES: hypothetical protein [unclassified Parafrankia]SQD96599.1 hypothetical protein FMEAI12_3660007 [Parafrankia sp. Ea1.12]